MTTRSFVKTFLSFLSSHAEEIAEDTLEWLEANYGDGDEEFDPEDIIDEIVDALVERFPDLPFVDERSAFTALVAPIVYAFCNFANPIMADDEEE